VCADGLDVDATAAIEASSAMMSNLKGRQSLVEKEKSRRRAAKRTAWASFLELIDFEWSTRRGHLVPVMMAHDMKK
jgi:hypothetical protein